MSLVGISPQLGGADMQSVSRYFYFPFAAAQTRAAQMRGLQDMSASSPGKIR